MHIPGHRVAAQVSLSHFKPVRTDWRPHCARPRARGTAATRSQSSQEPLTLFSPSKVNLFLRIIRRRPDGFHDLASLFHVIDLGDTMTFSTIPGQADSLTCDMEGVPTDASNLVIKALNLFRRHTGIDHFFQVHLEKIVPHGAGLGGGSANAATTLWAANELAGRPATNQQLLEWSGEIGSDVSIFFSNGAAYCTGRGEVVEDVEPPLPLDTPLLLVKPVDMCVNDLERPAFARLPELQELKAKLQNDCDNRFSAVFMTGSGSTMVGVGSSKAPLWMQERIVYQDMFCSPAKLIARQPNEWSNYQLTSRLKTRCPEPCYRRFDVNMRSCVLSVVAMAWLAVSVSAVQDRKLLQIDDSATTVDAAPLAAADSSSSALGSDLLSSNNGTMPHTILSDPVPSQYEAFEECICSCPVAYANGPSGAPAAAPMMNPSIMPEDMAGAMDSGPNADSSGSGYGSGCAPKPVPTQYEAFENCICSCPVSFSPDTSNLVGARTAWNPVRHSNLDIMPVPLPGGIGFGLHWAWVPFFGFIFGAATIISLLVIWLAQGHPRYRIPTRVRRYERAASGLSLIFAFICALGCILLTIFDAFAHPTLHWTFSGIFFVALLLSGLFNMIELGGLARDYRDDKATRSSFYIKELIQPTRGVVQPKSGVFGKKQMDGPLTRDTVPNGAMTNGEVPNGTMMNGTNGQALPQNGSSMV
ncbi:hypothetical protein WJX79_008250 [Trebouxia sp. C0005]